MMETAREPLSKQALIAQNVALSQKVSQLKFELEQLKRVVFGSKSDCHVLLFFRYMCQEQSKPLHMAENSAWNY